MVWPIVALPVDEVELFLDVDGASTMADVDGEDTELSNYEPEKGC